VCNLLNWPYHTQQEMTSFPALWRQDTVFLFYMYVCIYIYTKTDGQKRLWYLSSPSPHCLDEWHHISGPSSVHSLQCPPSAGLPLGLYPVYNWMDEIQIPHLGLRKITKWTLELNWKFKPHKYKKFCILYQPLIMFGTRICETVFSVLHILCYTLVKFFIFNKTKWWKYIYISSLIFQSHNIYIYNNNNNTI
jgi:hypothetical protein